ncbi:hypothetical protein DQK91_23365, partial [Oceanidesulfovibrio marinus]
MDTLVDVVGEQGGFDVLGVTDARASDLPWFTRTVTGAHDEISLPASAVLPLLPDKTVRPSAFT